MTGLCLALVIVVVAPTATACLDPVPRTTTVDHTLDTVHEETWEERAQATTCADGVTTAGSLDAC